jgi:hypothetical protein
MARIGARKHSFWSNSYMKPSKGICFDFLRRKWLFIPPSLVLIVAGLASLLVESGPKYRIDFSGEAVLDVRPEEVPLIEGIRTAILSRLSGFSVIAARGLEVIPPMDFTELRQKAACERQAARKLMGNITLTREETRKCGRFDN